MRHMWCYIALGGSTALIVDWIEQQCARLSIKNEAKTSIIVVTGSKFMQQRTM